LEIEEFLSSKVRIKILKLLYELGELNIRRICEKTRSNYAVVKSHLTIMEKLGLIQHRKYGRISLYSLNVDDLKVEAIKRLFETWQTK